MGLKWDDDVVEDSHAMPNLYHNFMMKLFLRQHKYAARGVPLLGAGEEWAALAGRLRLDALRG